MTDNRRHCSFQAEQGLELVQIRSNNLKQFENFFPKFMVPRATVMLDGLWSLKYWSILYGIIFLHIAVFWFCCFWGVGAPRLPLAVLQCQKLNPGPVHARYELQSIRFFCHQSPAPFPPPFVSKMVLQKLGSWSPPPTPPCHFLDLFLLSRHCSCQSCCFDQVFGKGCLSACWPGVRAPPWVCALGCNLLQGTCFTDVSGWCCNVFGEGILDPNVCQQGVQLCDPLF